MTVKTLKEAEDRIRAAMETKTAQGGQGFSPAIQRIRQSAQMRRTGQPLPRG